MKISHATESNVDDVNSSRTQDEHTAKNWCAEVKHLKFPGKLHCILEQASKKGYDDIVSWSPCGTKFRIHNKADFETCIMARYFPAMSSYTSFRRQLNLYNIRLDVASTPDSEYYAHPLLIRGRLCLTKCITRRKNPPPKKVKTSLKGKPECGGNEKKPTISCRDFSCHDSFCSVVSGEQNLNKNKECHKDGANSPTTMLYEAFPSTELTSSCFALEPLPLVLDNCQEECADELIYKDPSLLIGHSTTYMDTRIPTSLPSIELDSRLMHGEKVQNGGVGFPCSVTPSSALVMPNFGVECKRFESPGWECPNKEWQYNTFMADIEDEIIATFSTG